jgi:DNA-binding transcriptional LysR family regulator
MLARLGDGGLQIAILVRPERASLRGLKFEELAQDAIRVAVAPGHPFAKRRAVKLAEVARERLLAYSREGYPEYHESLLRLFG